MIKKTYTSLGFGGRTTNLTRTNLSDFRTSLCSSSSPTVWVVVVGVFVVIVFAVDVVIVGVVVIVVVAAVVIVVPFDVGYFQRESVCLVIIASFVDSCSQRNVFIGKNIFPSIFFFLVKMKPQSSFLHPTLLELSTNGQGCCIGSSGRALDSISERPGFESHWKQHFSKNQFKLYGLVDASQSCQT